jgi:predicted amidohydrolase
MKKINVALAQIATKTGDKSHNLRIIENICMATGEKNTELMIFPELSVTGYICRDDFYQLAEHSARAIFRNAYNRKNKKCNLQFINNCQSR